MKICLVAGVAENEKRRKASLAIIAENEEEMTSICRSISLWRRNVY
jgi:hypothetical protein